MKEFGILAFASYGARGGRVSGAVEIPETLSQCHSYGGFSNVLYFAELPILKK